MLAIISSNKTYIFKNFHSTFLKRMRSHCMASTVFNLLDQLKRYIWRPIVHIQWNLSFIVIFKHDNEVSQTSVNMQHPILILTLNMHAPVVKMVIMTIHNFLHLIIWNRLICYFLLSIPRILIRLHLWRYYNRIVGIVGYCGDLLLI